MAAVFFCSKTISAKRIATSCGDVILCLKYLQVVPISVLMSDQTAKVADVLQYWAPQRSVSAEHADKEVY